MTQTTFGISRDDAAPFLAIYFQKGLLEQDPFVSIDRDGVGELITFAAQRGRSRRPKIKLGICGEHGGDPASIALCEENVLDYVSCSPFRVPIARLAAAQAVIAKKYNELISVIVWWLPYAKINHYRPFIFCEGEKHISKIYCKLYVVRGKYIFDKSTKIEVK